MARLFSLGLIVAMLSGCHRAAHNTLPDMLIPQACVTKDIVLKNCDLRFAPPHCLTSVIRYKDGCAQVVVKP
jgi:ABC-type uncharacterized transport system auxiliary subunit